MNLCIDLCCGLKGFSSAFLEGGWEVITVDIEPKFLPDILCDIRNLTKEDIQAAARTKLSKYEIVVILASTKELILIL